MTQFECSKAFTVVFLGLVIGTAGFCLTLAGWFAPPINDSVRGVRLTGPILLMLGLVILLLSCLLCAISQQLCCARCLWLCHGAHADQDDYLATSVHVNASHAASTLLAADPSVRDTCNPSPAELEAACMVSANKYALSYLCQTGTDVKVENNGRVGNDRLLQLPRNCNLQGNQEKPLEKSQVTTDCHSCTGASPEAADLPYFPRQPVPSEHETPPQATVFQGAGVRVTELNRFVQRSDLARVNNLFGELEQRAHPSNSVHGPRDAYSGTSQTLASTDWTGPLQQFRSSTGAPYSPGTAKNHSSARASGLYPPDTQVDQSWNPREDEQVWTPRSRPETVARDDRRAGPANTHLLNNNTPVMDCHL